MNLRLFFGLILYANGLAMIVDVYARNPGFAASLIAGVTLSAASALIASR